MTGEFPAKRASNAEKSSIWWRHHVLGVVSLWAVTDSILFAHGTNMATAQHITYTLHQIVLAFSMEIFTNQLFSWNKILNGLQTLCKITCFIPMASRDVSPAHKCFPLLPEINRLLFPFVDLWSGVFHLQDLFPLQPLLLATVSYTLLIRKWRCVRSKTCNVFCINR